ncbi:MAG: TldD/PmbA family protein [Promethearchaeota archaeon]
MAIDGNELLEKVLKHFPENIEAAVRVKDVLRYQIRLYNSEIELFKQWNFRELEVFVGIDGRVGSTTILDPDEQKLFKQLDDFLSFIKTLKPTGLWKGLQDKISKPSSIQGIHNKKILELEKKAPEYLQAAIEASRDAGAKRTAGAMFFSTIENHVGTSYGFNGNYNESSYELTLRSFVDPESSGQGIAVGRTTKNIEKKITAAGKEAGEIAAKAVGGKSGKPGIYDLVLHPTVAASIMSNLMSGANPLLMLIGMSPFLGFLNQKLAVDFLNVSDDGTIEDGLATAPFDFEGTPTQKTPLFENGTLTGVVHSATTAKMYKTKSTGNAHLMELMKGAKILVPTPTNIVIEPGDYSLEELLESNNPTIYVTSNWYLRWTNQLEGIFSTIPRDGMFLIENGEIKEPIRKLRISDDMFRILNNIEALGKESRQVKWWEVSFPTFTPHIKIKNVPMTAATQ